MFAENLRKIGQIITDHFFGGVVVVQIPTVLRVQGQGNGWGYWLVPVVGAIRGQGKMLQGGQQKVCLPVVLESPVSAPRHVQQ